MSEAIILVNFGEERKECLRGNVRETSGVFNIMFLELFSKLIIIY